MRRRFFLQLSAAGAAGALWGCQSGSDDRGAVMTMTHGPSVTGRSGSAAARSGGGFSWFGDASEAPAVVTREVHVLEPNAAYSAFDAQGYEYEIEPLASRVLERGMMGVLLREFGGYGMGADQLNGPVALAFGPDDALYVVDRGNHRVQVFDRDARHLREIGGWGSAEGQLSYPSDVLFDSAGRLYVADTRNHRVQLFERNGRSLLQFGELGTEPGMLNGPTSLAFGPDGALHVLDSGNGRVQVFDSSGRFLRGYGQWGDQPGQLSLPRALALAGDGTAFVADVASASIEVWKADGSFEQRFEPMFEDGARAAPVDIALAPGGDLYISAVAAAA